MKLWTYVGKNVRIELTDGQLFTGYAFGYDDEIYNESGEDSLNLKARTGGWYDFNESEIKSIEIID
ncbi:LSM domain protein [Staphylococcus pseudintermedius]|uniref:LSM domain protein n=1 Tax=Staphylococcus pseudintermedius TaxID=283734 RepID=UPI003860A79B